MTSRDELSFNERLRAGGEDSLPSSLPSAASPDAPAPGASSSPPVGAHPDRPASRCGDLPAGGDYDPFDPYEPRNVHLRQGKSVEQYRRNEDLMVYVFGACLGFVALVWILTVTGEWL